MSTDYLKLSREAFEASTTYLDSNYRQDWDYSLRAFRNEHASSSKYSSEEYKARSRLFRPKTRSIIRKNEAAAMQAAFSNNELVTVEAGNPDDVMSVASAAAIKEVLEYRLKKTIPTFETYIGGVQDAQTTGAVCSYQYWEYQTKKDGTKKKDQPCIELRPIENIRFDAGASWTDPVNTSPYFCDIIPMYVCDVKGMMNNKDEKTGAPKWKKLKDSEILLARPDVMESLREARQGGKQDPHQEESGIKDFDIVWVMRWCMRDSQNDDQCFYTMGTNALLTDAKPIEEVYFHGKRPYVIGYSILETHRALKSGVPILGKMLQQETNDVANQRIDNVKFVLNKRWLVARGRQVDVQSLVRGVPGGVTLTTDPKNDIVESNWPDVTSSAYVEQDRLNSDFDDLLGNFSPSTKVANNAVNDTLGGSRLAAAGAGLMTEYLLHTVNETWWVKVLRQLTLLEQYYETDETVLAVCANKAQLFPRFGLSRITDMMLMAEVNVDVSMAMGDPNQRLQKFVFVTKAANEMVATAPPGANVKEQLKELYANAGYRDGARFYNEQQDPRLLKAMQMVQQLQGMLKGKQMELQTTAQIEQQKLLSNERVKGAEIRVNADRIAGDLRIREAELAVQARELELQELKLRLELQVAGDEHALKAAELGAGLEEARLKLQGERERIAAESVEIAAKLEAAQNALTAAKTEKENQARAPQIAAEVTRVVQEVAASLASMRGRMDATQGKVDAMNKGLGALAGVVLQPKKKASGLKLKKPDGKKTTAVIVGFDDGTEEELTVG